MAERDVISALKGTISPSPRPDTPENRQKAFKAQMILGIVALIFATINVVGGYLVTHRMLDMFKK